MPSTELTTEKKLEQPIAWVVHSKTAQSVNSPQTEILRLSGEQPMERVMAHNQGFANNPNKGREAGKKGGEHSHQNERGQQSASNGDRQQSGSHGTERGGSGNFANDRERASEAGRKGGQH
ncbi:general stress protein [Bosea sp. OAE752]|uniref:general stress protein n=1 Tax=Bosea sp. OAE752 TaxID=2663873 RepID=UPI003D1AC429